MMRLIELAKGIALSSFIVFVLMMMAEGFK